MYPSTFTATVVEFGRVVLSTHIFKFGPSALPPTTASADFLADIPRPLGFGSPFGHRQGSPQVSHMRFPSYLLDLRRLFPYRYGVNRSLPALPESSPHIQFLFVRLTICYRLPSSVCYLPDSTGSLVLPSIGRTVDFHHINTRALLSAQRKTAPQNPRFCGTVFFMVNHLCP